MNSLPLPLLEQATLDEIRTLMPGKFTNLISCFIDDATQQAAQLAHAVHGANIHEVGRLAHSLKSSARQLGAVALGESAWELEKAARGAPGQPPASIPEIEIIFKTFHAHLGPTCEALQNQIRKA